VIDTWPQSEQALSSCAKAIEYYLDQKDKDSADQYAGIPISGNILLIKYGQLLLNTGESRKGKRQKGKT
jgi:hypothetical protein